MLRFVLRPGSHVSPSVLHMAIYPTGEVRAIYLTDLTADVVGVSGLHVHAVNFDDVLLV